MSQTGCGSDLGSMCVCGNCNRWRVTDCAMIYNKAKDALKMEYEILIIQKLERIDCQTGSIGHETTFEQRLTDGERTGPLPFPFNWPAVFAFLCWRQFNTVFHHDPVFFQYTVFSPALLTAFFTVDYVFVCLYVYRR